MALWKALDGILKPVAVSKFTGIDRQDMFGIDDGAATYLKNLCAGSYPAMAVRPGFTKLGNIGGSVQGLGAYQDGTLHAIASEWYYWSGSAFVPIMSLATTGAYSFCNFRGSASNPNLMLLSNGQSQYWASSATGSASEIPELPPENPGLDTHDNRVYAAGGNNGETQGNYVSWCSLGAPQYWTPGMPSSDPGDAGGLTVETPYGTQISCIKAGPQHLIIFMPRYMTELWGTDPVNFQLQEVSSQIGCVAQNAAVMAADGNCYFVGLSGIYQYSGGVIPDKSFSLPVQWYIDNMNQAAAGTCVAGTDGTSVYFAIPTGTATAPNYVLVYNTRYPGIWYVYELGFSCTAMTMMAGVLYMGDSNGNVYQMNAGTTDNGTATPWEWTSKPFGGGSLAQRQQWNKMWITVTLPAGSTLQIWLSPSADGNDFVQAGSLTGSALTQSTRVLIPVTMVANANWVRVRLVGTGPCTVHEVTRQMREMPYV